MVAKATSNKKLILIVIALLLALTALIYIYSQNKSVTATSNQTSHATEQNSTPLPASLPDPEENTDTFATLIDDDLLTQPIPEDQALIKDELGQLKDIQQQLQEQKELLEQQHQDADQLLELKAQQLAELERELKANR